MIEIREIKSDNDNVYSYIADSDVPHLYLTTLLEWAPWKTLFSSERAQQILHRHKLMKSKNTLTTDEFLIDCTI